MDSRAYHLVHMLAMAEGEFDAAYFRTGNHLGKYFDNDGESKRQIMTFKWC